MSFLPPNCLKELKTTRCTDPSQQKSLTGIILHRSTARRPTQWALLTLCQLADTRVQSPTLAPNVPLIFLWHLFKICASFAHRPYPLYQHHTIPTTVIPYVIPSASIVTFHWSKSTSSYIPHIHNIQTFHHFHQIMLLLLHAPRSSTQSECHMCDGYSQYFVFQF